MVLAMASVLIYLFFVCCFHNHDSIKINSITRVCTAGCMMAKNRDFVTLVINVLIRSTSLNFLDYTI